MRLGDSYKSLSATPGLQGWGLPQNCSPCFLVAKPGSTAKWLVVEYGELNKKALNHSGSIPNMESTLEKIPSCHYKMKMDKRSVFR